VGAGPAGETEGETEGEAGGTAGLSGAPAGAAAGGTGSACASLVAPPKLAKTARKTDAGEGRVRNMAQGSHEGPPFGKICAGIPAYALTGARRQGYVCSSVFFRLDGTRP
jgi:hypothetical protein